MCVCICVRVCVCVCMCMCFVARMWGPEEYMHVFLCCSLLYSFGDKDFNWLASCLPLLLVLMSQAHTVVTHFLCGCWEFELRSLLLKVEHYSHSHFFLNLGLENPSPWNSRLGGLPHQRPKASCLSWFLESGSWLLLCLWPDVSGNKASGISRG